MATPVSSSSKRTPSNVSMEEDGPQAKNQRTNEDEAPTWAKQILEKSEEISLKMDDFFCLSTHCSSRFHAMRRRSEK